MKTLLRPKIIFIILWIVIFNTLLVIDFQNSVNTIDSVFTYSVLGSLFLAQCVAIILTASIVMLHPRFKQSRNKWLSAVLAVTIAVLAAVLFYYKGPRIVTEADGQASITYFCELGELYSTAVDREFVCVLKNMPLAVSNIAVNQYYITEWIPPYEQIVGFVALGGVMTGSYLLLARKLVPKQPQLKKT